MGTEKGAHSQNWGAGGPQAKGAVCIRVGSEGPAEGQTGSRKGRRAPLKGTSFLSEFRSHTITHTHCPVRCHPCHDGHIQ